MALNLSKKQRLIATIAISLCFFLAEIVVALLTRSLALFADAFHYLSDLLGFVVALVAVVYSENDSPKKELSFGYQRTQLLGAFFNGAILLALGISIFVQSIERFIVVQHVDKPMLVLIMGCVGFGLNMLSAAFLHEHHHHDHGHGHDHGHDHGHSHGHNHAEHSAEDTVSTHSAEELATRHHAEHKHALAKIDAPGRDLGMLGVLLHVLGDAINNVGVMIAAVVIWKLDSEKRFYVDPAVGLFIAVMIFLSSVPLLKYSGVILLQSAPRGVDLSDVKHDLEKIPGIDSIHELHVWRLDQKKAIASAHVVVSDQTVSNFMEKAKTVSECLHAYGIHSATLQPEFVDQSTRDMAQGSNSSLRRRRVEPAPCQLLCNNLCENLMCCKL